MYKQILINAKLKTGKRGQETELNGRRPLRRRRRRRRRWGGGGGGGGSSSSSVNTV